MESGENISSLEKRQIFMVLILQKRNGIEKSKKFKKIENALSVPEHEKI